MCSSDLEGLEREKARLDFLSERDPPGHHTSVPCQTVRWAQVSLERVDVAQVNRRACARQPVELPAVDRLADLLFRIRLP